MQNKSTIREQLLLARKTISSHLRFEASKHAANRILKTDLFKKSQHIACYVAVRHEFDCSAIMDAVLNENKKCFLPILSDKNNKVLQFGLYDQTTSLKPNKYRILEPETTNLISPADLDLVLVPLVGFDLKGRRLGMGGGYYDRTFEFLNKKTTPTFKPFLLGLAYELQKIPRVPTDNWDVLMDGILTEKQWYQCEK